MLKCTVKEHMDRENIGIREMSRRLDYRFDSVRKLYHDEMERFPRDLIEKVCLELDITPGDLFRLEKEPSE